MELTTGKSHRPRRVMVYGAHGSGKSTFAASAPNPIAIDTEDGMGDLGTPRYVVKSLDEFREAVREVFNSGSNYESLIIDSVDWLEKFVQSDVAGKAGLASVADISFGKGFEEAHDTMRDILRTLAMVSDKHGLHIVTTCHAAVRKFEDPRTDAYDRFVPALHVNGRGQGVAMTVQEWHDEVFFLTEQFVTRETDKGFGAKAVKAIGTGKHILCTTGTPAYDAKSRASLPDEIVVEAAGGFDTYLNLIKGEQNNV